MTRKNLGFIGPALLVGGLFTPVVTMPVVGSINLFNNSSNVFAIILVALAGVSAGLAARERLLDMMWPGIAASGILLYLFGRLQYGLSEMRESIARDLQGNPFAGMAQNVAGSIQLQWGWLILAAGAGLILYVGISARRTGAIEAAGESGSAAPLHADGASRLVALLSLVLLVAAPAWDIYGRSGAASASSVVSTADTPSTDLNFPGAMDAAEGPDSEEASYISENLRVYDLDAKYYDSILDGRVPGVRFKIRNSGNRTLNRVTVRVVFLDADDNPIAEQEYDPVLVSAYSFGNDNSPLRPNYIWQQDRNRFFVANNVPTEWQTGSARAAITDIEFGPDE